jgi:hypothetical protein
MGFKNLTEKIIKILYRKEGNIVKKGIRSESQEDPHKK